MDENEKLFIQIAASISRIDTNLQNCLNVLQQHEQRLVKIEQQKTSFKDGLIQLLVKCLLVSACATAALSGAGGILAKIFAQG